MIFIDFAKIDYKCPYCQHKYEDDKDVMYKRINKNKSFYTKTKCINCDEKFGVAVDMTGQMVGFKYKKHEFNN